MNAHHGRRPDQAVLASDEAMSQVDTETEATQAPTVSDLWRRRAAALVKAHEAADDDFGPEREQDEIEWAMVRTPSTVRYEVVHKLEAVLQCWFDYGPASDRRDVLLLQSAICDLSFESLK